MDADIKRIPILKPGGSCFLDQCCAANNKHALIMFKLYEVVLDHAYIYSCCIKNDCSLLYLFIKWIKMYTKNDDCFLLFPFL